MFVRMLCLAAAVVVAACAGPAPPVRVMTFNVRYGTADDGENSWPHRRSLLIETIAAFAPDLLGTQETLAFQHDELLAALAGYASHAAGRDDGTRTGEMTALFYREQRFERLDGGHFWLSDRPDVPGSVGWDAGLTRMASWVVLRDRAVPGERKILFLNAHLDNRGEQARLESARLIRREAERLRRGARIVITGDFNADEGSPPYLAMFGDESPVRDAYRTVHPDKAGDEGTFSDFTTGRTDGLRLDWIGLSGEWSILEAAIDRTSRDGRTPSDHFPVTAVVR